MILDAKSWHDFMNKDSKMEPIHHWLKRQNGKLIYSNHKKIKQEMRSRRIKQQIKELGLAGKTKLINGNKVEGEIKKINKRLLKSNDLHILALAKASQTKLLCSEDRNLHEDFKNIAKGRVYQNETHRRLLTRDACP